MMLGAERVDVECGHSGNATMVYGHDASVLEELIKQAKTFE